MMDNNVSEFQTIDGQPPPCENCANYHKNAERAYQAMEAFSRTRQEAISLQKQVKDLNTVLKDRQEFVLDLQKKLETERMRSTQLEHRLNEKQIELDCTKEQLEFVRAEADKSKELAEKTSEHEKKLNDMQKELDQTNASHEVICKRMFNLASIVKNYQKQYGDLNLTQAPNEQPSTSKQYSQDSTELSPRRDRPPKKSRKKANTNVKASSVLASSTALNRDMLMAELDSDDEAMDLPTDTALNRDLLMAELSSDDAESPKKSLSPSRRKQPENKSDLSTASTSQATASLNIRLLMDELDNEDSDDSQDDLTNFNMARPRTRSTLKSNVGQKPTKRNMPTIRPHTNDSVRMPPPRAILRRSQTRSVSSTTAIPSQVVTKELRSRTISTNSDDLEHPKQTRKRRLSSTSSTSSASPPKSLLLSKESKDHPKTSNLSKTTRTNLPAKKKNNSKSLDSDTELIVDDPKLPTIESTTDRVKAPLEIVDSTEKPEASSVTPASNAMTRKRRVENSVPVATKAPTKTNQTRPPSPRRALLIDIPAQNPQRKLKTTRVLPTKTSTKPTTPASTKQSFNFIAAVLRDFTSKKVSMRDALKRFNSEVEKHGGDNSMTTDQFSELLCRFIRGENFGDLWFVLKQSAKGKQSANQDALLSSAERLFFEFVFELNTNDEEGRWPGIFLALARTLCADCEQSPANSLVQKCQDIRVMMCALYFSDQHEKIDESRKSECIDQITAFVERLLAEDDASTVVRVLCFIYTTNGSFLFKNLLSLATAPIARIQRVRQRLTDSPADANTFFALIQKDVPESLVEALRRPPEQDTANN